MKKIFIILFFLCIGVIANAQTGVCNVSGDSGASVVINITGFNSSSNVVDVTIGSDSEKYVNVTFNFIYDAIKTDGTKTSKSLNVKSQTYVETVAPNQSEAYSYHIDVPKGYEIEKITGVKVSGRRCEE